MTKRTKRYLVVWGVSVLCILTGGLIAMTALVTAGTILLVTGLVALTVSYFLWYWDIV